MRFGDRLQQLREQAGLSQPALAEKSGVPVGTIRDYEQHRRMPTLPRFVRMARAIGRPLEDFIAPELERREAKGGKRRRKMD